jgi:hypothetical protein
MITNQRILAEILARKEKAQQIVAELKIHDGLKPAVDALNKINIEELTELMAGELRTNFEYDEIVNCQGFEWYYDGRYFPDALGYYGNEATEANSKTPSVVGSNTHKARADFEVVDFGYFLCGDCGYIDVNLVLKPFLDITCEAGEHYLSELRSGDYDEQLDEVENLYVLTLFEVVHHAMDKLVKTKLVDDKNIKFPFYISLNNHDWSPFLVYVVKE